MYCERKKKSMCVLNLNKEKYVVLYELMISGKCVYIMGRKMSVLNLNKEECVQEIYCERKKKINVRFEFK